MNKLVSSLLGFALLLCWGCHSVPAPPGFVGGGTGTAGRIELPTTLSKAAQYALLCCYIDQEGDNAARWAAASLAVAQNARLRLQEELLAEQALPLREKYSDALTVGADGNLVWRDGALANRTDWETLATMFAEVEGFLLTQQALPVPVEEIRSYLTARGDSAQLRRFEEWVKNGHSELVVTAVGPSAQLFELQRLRDAANKKRELLAVEGYAHAAMDTGQGLQAMELLDEALKSVGSDNSPALLGDYSTRPRLEAMRRQAPQLVVSRELQALSALLLEGDGWRVGEARLGQDLVDWRQDSRFADALEQNAEVIRNQAGIFLQQRSMALTAEVSELLSAKNWWKYRRAKMLCEEEWFSARPCYSDPITAELGKELLAEAVNWHRKVSRELVQFWLAMQQRADEIEGRFGLVAALDWTLQSFAESQRTGADSAVTAEELTLSQQRAAHAREMLLERKLRQQWSIQGVTAELPGAGVTWQRDIAGRLDAFLKASPLERFIQVQFETADETEFQPKVAVTDGRLAEYGSASEPERTATRMFRCVSEPHQKIQEGNRVVYTQELYDQEIVTRTIERTAHIRLSLVIRVAGIPERRVEVNEFLRRDFVVEESRPLQVAGQHVVEDLAQALPVATEPKLRVDRVWSEGEVLDEARRRVLDQVLLWVLDALAEEMLERYERLDAWLESELEDDEFTTHSNKEFAQYLEAMGEFSVLLETWKPQALLEKLPPLPENPSEAHAAIHAYLTQVLEKLQFVLMTNLADEER